MAYPQPTEVAPWYLHNITQALELNEAMRSQLARDVNGNPESLTLCVAYTQTNGDVLYKFGWQELTY